MNNNNKIVTNTGLAAAFVALKRWLPFTKDSNGFIHFSWKIPTSESNIDKNTVVYSIGEENAPNNLFEIRKNGEIFILKTEEDKTTSKSLQTLLNNRNNFIIQDTKDWNNHSSEILNKENFGAIVYFLSDIYGGSVGDNGDPVLIYTTGIYIVTVTGTKGNAFALSKIGTTSSTEKDPSAAIANLETRMVKVEDFIQNPITVNDIQDLK